MTITTDLGAPEGYAEFITDLKNRVRTTQLRAVRAANTELLRLYWSIGRDILDRQEKAGWGTKIVDRTRRTSAASFLVSAGGRDRT